MTTKMKAQFLPKDYQVSLFRKLQHLKQKELSVQSYTKEFYKLNIEDTTENISKYINGLKYKSQDELAMLQVHIVEEAYQFVLKAK